jgi:NitT/TauT family transport system ATP-binding protein
MTASPAVALDRITKSYGELRVLEEITLAVAEGETVAIVGPSGCGKSTLLRIVLGLEAASSGEVVPHAGGTDETALVFQQPSLFPWWTVRQNVEFGLRLRVRAGRVGADERRARVDELLAAVGLADFGHHKPDTLSGGMRQRANLARALAIQPGVLLLDEPFSAVDALTKERLQLMLAEVLARFQTAAILVTHDIRESVFLADRVVVLGERPARIVHVAEVEHFGPRDVAFQHSPELAVIAQDVYEHLQLTGADTRPVPA